MSAYFCLPLSIDVHQAQNMQNARKKCLEKIPLIREEINNVINQLPICPNNMLGQMASIQIPKVDPIKFNSKLVDDFKIEIPVFQWADKILLRVSYQVYNTEEDINNLIQALNKLLK